MSADETRAPAVDLLEAAALVAVPGAAFAAGAAVGGHRPVAGLIVGAVFGGFFAALRRSVYAVRTPEGIERRLRRPDPDPDESVWIRLATVEYPKRYELPLAVACGVVAIGALAAVVLVDDAYVVLRLLMVSLVGMLGALGSLGFYYMR